MLSFNDAIAAPSNNETTCIVCRDLLLPEQIIWHEVRTVSPHAIVPVCVDCADLFHDVKPTCEATE